MAYNKSQKLQDNIAAIKLVLQLDREGRMANDDERAVLRRYSGFGGLKFILNPASGEADKQYWKASDLQYFRSVRELYGIIHLYAADEREERAIVDSVKRSVNTAFYTPSAVIDAIAAVFKARGVAVNTLLDPSAGIGKFGDSFKQAYGSHLNVTAFEKDVLTGKILSALNPDDRVTVDGFETIPAQEQGTFDLVTSNIPFGDIRVMDDAYRHSKNDAKRYSVSTIHNYFFLKALDQVREGGFIAFITSRGFMDSPSNNPIRQEIAKNACIVGAFRLPDGMFRDEAGTDVGSDLVVLQKVSGYDMSLDPYTQAFCETGKGFSSTDGDDFTDITINEYWWQSMLVPDGEACVSTHMVRGTDPYGKPTLLFTHDGGMEGIAKQLKKYFSNHFNEEYVDYYIKHAPKQEAAVVEQQDNAVAAVSQAPVEQPVQPVQQSQHQSQGREGGSARQQSHSAPVQLDLFSLWDAMDGNGSSPEDTQAEEAERAAQEAARREAERQRLAPRPWVGDHKDWYRDGTIVVEPNTHHVGVLTGNTFTPLDHVTIDQTGRLRQYVLARDAYHELYNTEAETREEQPDLREMLNRHYDNFLLQYGHLNERKNACLILMDVLGRDSLALENEEGRNFVKADIFVRPVSFISYEVTHVDTPEEALNASLNRFGHVDLDYMAGLTDNRKDELPELLKGQIYLMPDGNYELASKALSGNIYEKLEFVSSAIAALDNAPGSWTQEQLDALKDTKTALEATIPEQIAFDDIGLQFGERWIPTEYYEEYVSRLFDTKVAIHYSERIDEYSLKAEDRYNNLKIKEEFCVRGEYKTFDGMALLGHAFHNTTPDIQKCIGYDEKGNDLKGLDMEKIQLANTKIDEIRDGFAEYLTNLPKERRDALQEMYNRKFNCFVKAKYDGSYQTFPGIDLKSLASPKFNIKSIYKSQKDCVKMILENGGGICDHEVGTGKSLIMCMAAHEMHRLGIANKPMIIAMKANVAEIAATYQAAFPDDKILYAAEKDFSPANRVQFFNRIKNNDFACVIMSHDQFGKIPQAMEIQEQILQDELRDIDEALNVIRQQGGHIGGRMLTGLEKRKENMQVRLQELQHDMANRKDDFVDFGRMGIDHLFVDESHQFKNLMFTTRHQRVSGLGNPGGSQKALNLLYAIRTIQNRTGKDLGATFLSGTTISNSLTELYLLFKYLRPAAMAKQGIHSFDAWAAVYAKKTSDYEFSVTNAVVQKERFRYFLKVPELATFYNEITDYRTGEDVGLDRPDMNVILHDIEPTADQQDFNQRLVQFAQTGEGGLIFRAPLNEREQKGKMLIATDASRKASLDMRLVSQELFDDDPNNKASHCARLVAEYYKKFDEQKGTQFIFSDLSTYKPNEWNIFQEIKDKLVSDYGIPADEIRFIQEASSNNVKQKMIDLMNEGKIRVLFGSTSTLGTGVNAQQRAVAVHHIDIPWRPSDLEQRNGRARRTGNWVAKEFGGNHVDVIIYAVKRTLDSYKFNLLQNKQLFITQLKTNQLGTRVIDEGAMDEEHGMNFAEYVAILSGNDDLLQKAKLEKKILALESERKTYMQARRDTEWRLKETRETLVKNETVIAGMTADNDRFQTHVVYGEDGAALPGLAMENISEFTADGTYNVEEMGAALQEAGRTIGNKNRQIGNVYGFPLMVDNIMVYDNQLKKEVYAGNKFYVKGNYLYEYNNGRLAMSKDNRLAAVRYGVNALEKIPGVIEQYEKRNESLRANIAEYERIAGKPWSKEEELKGLRKEMEALDAKIRKSLDETTKNMPKEEVKPYRFSKEGRQHKVTFARNAYPFVSVLEMREIASHGDWRSRGYVEGGRYDDDVVVSVPEVEGRFPSRQSVEAFIEKVEQINKERKENLDWLVLKAQEDPKGEKVCVENEVIFACRDALQQQGVDWQNVQEPHAGIAPAQEEIEIKRLMSVANTTDVYAKPVSDGLCHRARTMLVDRGIDWHTGLALSVVGDHVRRWHEADESQLSLYAQGVLSRDRVFQPDDAAKFTAQELQLLDNATSAARGTFKDDRDRRDAYERLVVVVDYLGEQLMKRGEHTDIQQPEQEGRLPDADFYQQYIRTHFKGYSDDSIQKVSDALVRITEEHTKLPDWDKREYTQSQMRVEAKRALRSYGFGNATDVVDLMMTHVLPQDHPLNRPKMLVYSAGEYGGSEKGEERRTLAHSLKKFGSDTAVRAVVDKMVDIFNNIPLEDKKKMVLVPVPGSSGQPTYMKEVVRELSELTHIPFTDGLFCDAHESLYHLKKYGARYNRLPDIHYMMDGGLPSGAIAVLVDNVLDTGKTLSSAAKANFGEGVEVRAAVLAHTDYYKANNPQLVVKTASELHEEYKALAEQHKADIKAGYAAALAALEVSQQGVDADTVDSMKGLLKVSWLAVFGRNEARERLHALGVDWQTGQAVSSAAAVPVSFQLVPQNHVSMVSDTEKQMMGLIAADLVTGNHLLGRRPVAQRQLMADIFGAFAAVKTLSVTPRQRDLLLSLSLSYNEGLAEIARQSEVSEAVLMEALKRVDQVRPAVGQDIAVQPYQIYYEDDAFVVDYPPGYGFADKIVRQVAATHDGQPFERAGRTMVLFDSERNVYSFIEHVQNLRVAVANNLRNGIIDKLRRAGISVSTNVEEGERVLQQVNTKPRLMAVDRNTNEYKKKVSDAEQRIESRLAELNRSRNEDGSIAQPASRVPVKEPTSPSTDGGRDASSSTAKVRNKFGSSKFLAEKMAIYIESFSQKTVFSVKDYPVSLIKGLGLGKKNNQNSEYIQITNESGDTYTLRISDHQGNARNIILKGVRTDRGYSIVLRTHLSPDGKFKTSKWADVNEYVYNNPTKERLVDISKSIFGLLDTGEYIDIAHADEHNISPRQDIREQRAVSADMRYMLVPDSPSPIFISNARMALDKIKQEKATPEQWLNMIEKHGGMKAGEDRWTGLSGWLRSSEERLLTKQQVIDYINENQIQIEEVHYGNVDDFNSSDAVKAYQKEFDELKQALVDHREEMKDSAHREYSEYCSAMQEKYGDSWEGFLEPAERVQERALQKRYELYVSGYGTDDDDIVFSEMTIRHSPQSLRWQRAFYHENGRLMIDDETDAASFLGEAHFINSTRLKFTTKGLDDKREIALVVPTIESWNEYDIVHFGGAGDGRAVAWIRFGSTTTADGERVLVLDEIQSKRHQEGREQGYRRGIRAERDAVAKVWAASGRTDDAAFQKLQRLNDEIRERKYLADDRPPAAPFEKNWQELSMKRMLRYAAENGYDRVAWTTGMQQAERYNLGGKVVRIAIGHSSYYPKFYNVFAYSPTGVIIINASHEGVSEEEVLKFYGNQIGEKLIKGCQESDRLKALGEVDKSKSYVLDGVDMDFGGEGLTAFYDQILPNFANKYGKHWGVAVEDVALPTIGESMHSIPVTDQMKQDVREGQPMFFRNGERQAYGFVHNGTIYIDPRIATAETPIHEYTHLWAEVLRQRNPQEWQNIVQMMKATPEVWNNVRQNYPTLRTDDQIADEALAQFSGQRGYERLQEFAAVQSNGNTIFDKITEVLEKFWKGVAEFFGIHYTSKEQVADRILYDLLNEVNPLDFKIAEPQGLREQQEALIESDHFKQWFGDWKGDPANASKVVDGRGRPLVVEHATNADFTIFDISHLGENSHDKGLFGAGFYFGTHTPGWLNDTKNVMQVYLDIKHPIEIDDHMLLDIYSVFKEKLDTPALRDMTITSTPDRQLTVGEYIDHIKAVDALIAENPALVREMMAKDEELEFVHPRVRELVWREHEIINRTGFPLYMNWQAVILNQIGSEAFSAALKKDGYDGIIVDRGEAYKEYVAFDAAQIKSATNNVGLYSRENPDIRYHLAAEKEDMKLDYTSVIAASREVPERAAEPRKFTAEDREAGGALVDHLRSMGISVHTDNRDNRRVLKAAERDQSNVGKVRHFKTESGDSYGFAYKGQIHLDLRKIDAELPLHEYAHLWCDALRRINPDNWNSVVDMMKQDAATWQFVKTSYPELTSDNDLAEEVIAHYSGKRGAQKLQEELERMTPKDDNYSSRWGNVFQNVAKAVQDFWKHIGDSLNYQYSSKEDLADQILNDFAKNVNPVKKVERWLMERDKEYARAVESGDMDLAAKIFEEALQENLGNGVTPFVAVDGYRGKLDLLARAVKQEGNMAAINEAADLMAPLVPAGSVLVPAPSHEGHATDMLHLANAIAERTGSPVADVLQGEPRESQRDYKRLHSGKSLSADMLGIRKEGELPEGKLPVVIDNVVNTGNTAEACVKALGKGMVLSLASAASQERHVASLNSARPVVYDKEGRLIPLSERFELKIKWLGRLMNYKPLDASAPLPVVKEPAVVQGLEEYSVDFIKQIAVNRIEEILAESGLDDEISINAVSVIGSRSRGEAHEGSDLDILMEYEGDYREDAMFDLLHENDLNINGISIDINPINPRYSMDTAHWLAQDARWREEDNNKNNIKKQENMATSDQLQTLLADLLPVNGRIELPRSIGLDQPMSVGSVDMNVKYILRADDGFRISDGEYSLPVSSIPGHQIGDFVKLVEEYAANSVDKKLENARPATLSEDGETVSVRLSDDTDEKYTRIPGGTHDDPALIYSNTHVDVFFYDSVKNTIESIDNEVGIDAYENRDGIFLVRSAEYEKAYQQLEEHDRVIAAEKSQTNSNNKPTNILNQYNTNSHYNTNSQQFFAPIYGATFTMGAPAPQQPQQSINIAEQFKYVSNLTEELGLEYVPYSMDKPITVRATTDVDWLDEDKVFTEVMCDGDNITIYENSQDSYDDKDGVHLSDLPSRIGMQVLNQMKEILTDDNRQMTVYVDTAHVPEYAIPAIINGDVTGLTEDEVEKVREFASQYPNCLFSVRDGGASYYERPAFGQATTCEDVDIVRVVTPKLLRRDAIDKPLDASSSHEEVQEQLAAVEKPAEKTGSKWDNLDYTQYVLPEGADVTNKRVFRIPPKDGEKFPTYHIAADFKGVHYDRVMYANDRRAFFEIDEQTGQRTNRATLDQLVAKYFGKQFAASMSIGSVQEAEHVLAEQNEAKEQAVSNMEQQTQEHEEKEQEAEQKSAEEAVQKKAEEARKAEKNDKTPVVVLQSMMVIDALHAAKENHGIWMNKEGKAAPVLLYSKTPVSAFNGLMMALHADANGYKSNNYVTFDGIKSEGCFIKKNEHGMKFNWYNWDKYVNRFNANDVIDKAAYEALAPEEKELYKVMSYKVERSIFNIDQSSMSEMKADDYKAYLAAQDTECLYRSGEALDHGTADYLRQYNELKAKHPDCILLLRADSSYNLYGEDVEKMRGLLGLHVEDHDPKGNETKYAVFPNSALDTYLPKMIRAGHRVAICDQLDTANSQNNHLADAVYNKAAVLEDALVKLSGDSNRVMKEPFFDTAYNAADDTLRFADRRRSNPGSEITTAIRRVNDSFRAAAAYTGGESRLNRAANSSMLPADAEKYDLLVSELAAGVLMSRAGLPATLSKESMETIPYWERELKESPKLMESIERDVNNAVDVLEKIKAGERIDYSAIRGKKAFDAIRPKLYTIANELSAIPDATDKHVVVVKDQQNKSAAVILPAGASLEVNNEIPGMNKNRFIIALRKQGFENVSFYNAGGALGLNQSNAFFADKTVEVAKLKQYELHVVEQLDLSKEIERSLKADLKQVQITFDDNKRPVLFVKSVDGDAFTVYPEPADVKLFFSSVRSPEFDTVRENIGQKYYGLVLRHPDLKTDALMPKANSDIDLSRITKVCVTKDRYSEDGRIIFATIDGKRQGPVQVSKAQAERMWVVEDPDLYRRLLAAVKFEEKLTLGSGQSEDGQGRFRDGHEEPSVDSSSPSAEGTEEDREEKQERKGGIRM